MMDQEESNHTLWLRKRFFSDPNRCLDLKTGDKLLQPGQYNERLFMVVEGLLVGSIENEEGRPYEIFRSGPGKIVGAYSFFSDAHRSYSTVVAEEPSRVAYIERSALKMGTPENQDFAEQILPAVVDEIYLRQLQAHQLTIEREEAREQLARMEKLAALGQMAAGLAHELNNAIGVINNNAVWLADRMREYLSEKDSNGMFPFFEIGLESGITLSSAEVRQRSRELESRFQLSANQSKNLAKTGISNESLERFGRNLPQYIDRISYYFETGRVLNDMLHASEHAAR
jgi:CRP-like cAMP-binding protein